MYVHVMAFDLVEVFGCSFLSYACLPACVPACVPACLHDPLVMLMAQLANCVVEKIHLGQLTQSEQFLDHVAN